MEEEYDKSGSAWTQYDVRLLLHFMVGALVNDYHSFHLACNVKAAGKFDDVVFRYRRNEGEPEKLRLIQAKNTETTAITADDLVSKTNGDFDLMKYLDSYNEIRNSDKFREMEVQDAVLFTTRNIDKNLPPIQFSDITLTLDDSKDEDDILSFHGTTSRRLKFSSSEAENKFQIENNLHDFFKHFTLALIQPNEEQLATFTKQRFHALVPFYNGSFSDFYLELESQVTAWYKEKNGIWLTKAKAMQWVSEASQQDFSLINPLKNKSSSLCDKIDEKRKNIDWDDLNETARDHIRNLPVYFQGEDMHLKDLVDQEAERQVMNKTLKFLWQNETKIRIGQAVVDSVGYDEKSYIPRTILWPRLRPDNDRHNQTVSVFKTQEEFAESKENAILVNQETCTVLRFKGSLDAIDEVVERDSILFSKRKHCTMRVESKSDEGKNGPNRFSEEDLLEVVRGVAIISDTAGMGKSTILAHFCHLLKRKKPSTWVLRIELNDPKVTEEVDKLIVTPHDDTTLEFLKLFSQTENDLGKELFQQRLEGNGEIVVMFDGFDEIPDDHQTKIVDLLNTLKCTKIHQLWISTRPNSKKKLEETGGVLAFGLLPFSHEKQIKFITDFWHSKNERGKCKEESESFAEKLLESLSENLCDNEREFTGIPLQCRLLAEAFSGESSLPDHLDLIELYNTFWGKKFKTFYSEKCNVDSQNRHFNKHLKFLQAIAKGILQWNALRTLFNDKKELWEHLTPGDEHGEEPICPEWGLTGIDNRFIHQAFAEYFASLYLTEQRMNANVFDYLIQIVFCKERYRVVRCFINGLLPKKTTTSSVNRKISIELFENIRQGILKASGEGNEGIIRFIFSEVPMESLVNFATENNFDPNI